MARINVESELFIDPRFARLVVLCDANLDTALGSLIRAWTLAQKWFVTPSKRIPEREWLKHKINPAILEAGLAILEDGFIYVCGSEEQFGWLEKAKENGRKGGLKTAENKGKSLQPPSRVGQGKPPISSTSTSSSSSSSGSTSGNTTTVQIERAYAIWLATLERFGIPPSEIALPQENSIARAIGQIGFENVCLALEGQRYEKPNDTFDPRRHLSVDRVLHRDAKGKSRWEEFVNMAKAERQKRSGSSSARSRAPAVTAEPHPLDGREPTPEEVRAAKAKFSAAANRIGGEK